MRRITMLHGLISVLVLAACAVAPASRPPSVEPAASLDTVLFVPTGMPKPAPILSTVPPESPPVVEAQLAGESALEQVEWIRIPSGNVTVGSSIEQAETAYVACMRARGDCVEAKFRRETSQQTVFVDQFEITRYEVTNHQYSACVEAGICKPARMDLDDNSVAYRVEYSAPERPVVGISATDAGLYCREWLDGRLPHRTEWERAARGDDGRVYPWGGTFDAAKANLSGKGPSSAKSHPEGASPFGVHHMTGNVWEWTDQDVRSAGNMPPSVVVRGGGWTSEPFEGRIAYLGESLHPSTARYDIGIRCVREQTGATVIVNQTEPIAIRFNHVADELHWLVTHAARAQITCYTVLGRAISGSWEVEVGVEGKATIPEDSVTCALTAEGTDGSGDSAVLVFGQTPSECDLDPDPIFANIYEQHATSLGCASSQATTIPMIAEETFQGGHMMWRSDTDAVYVIYTPAGQWQSDPGWAWDGSDPDGVGMTPPDGLYEPVRGFGWLWRTHLGAEQGELGWATAPEQGYEKTGQVQEFEGGLLVRGGNPRVFVLLYKDRH